MQKAGEQRLAAHAPQLHRAVPPFHPHAYANPPTSEASPGAAWPASPLLLPLPPRGARASPPLKRHGVGWQVYQCPLTRTLQVPKGPSPKRTMLLQPTPAPAGLLPARCECACVFVCWGGSL